MLNPISCISMGKKSNLGERVMVEYTRWIWLKNYWSTSIFRHNYIQRLQKIVKKIKEASILWLEIFSERINTLSNGGIRKSVSECTTYRTLKQMNYNSRGLSQVPHLSAKKSEGRLQLAKNRKKLGNERLQKLCLVL